MWWEKRMCSTSQAWMCWYSVFSMRSWGSYPVSWPTLYESTLRHRRHRHYQLYQSPSKVEPVLIMQICRLHVSKHWQLAKMWLLYADRTQIVYISLYFSTHFNLTNTLQVTRLVVTEVLSQSFGLVTERRHDNARHIFHRRVWYRALSLSCAFIRSSGIILTPGYLCTKFRFCSYLRCWASPQRKIAYPSPSQSINRPTFLMRREPKLSLRKTLWKCDRNPTEIQQCNSLII